VNAVQEGDSLPGTPRPFVRTAADLTRSRRSKFSRRLTHLCPGGTVCPRRKGSERRRRV